METSKDIAVTSSPVDLDHKLMELETISETLEKLEGVNSSNDLA